MMNELRGMRHGMIWPWTIVTILAVTALLCGCSSAVSPAAVMDTAENYIKNSLLLVSTDQGELAYSTPERPVTLDHDNSCFTDSWNATGKWYGPETIRYMSQKNWMETESISRLCISRLSVDTVNVQLKNRNHFYII